MIMTVNGFVYKVLHNSNPTIQPFYIILYTNE